MARTMTLLYDDRETELPAATADSDHLWLPLEDLERATGWQPKPQGLCRADTCVPLAQAGWLDGDGDAQRLDFAAFARHLGHEAARDADRNVWSFGPRAGAGPGDAKGWGPVVASDFELPDVDGNLRSLAELRGKKVLLYFWASW